MTKIDQSTCPNHDFYMHNPRHSKTKRKKGRRVYHVKKKGEKEGEEEERRRGAQGRAADPDKGKGKKKGSE